MQNEVVVSFGIFDFNDISHNDISQLLEIQPDKVYIKGEKRNPKNPTSPLIKKNSWIMRSGLDKYSSFEDQLTSLLDIIENKLADFKTLCDRYYCEISCALFVYVDNDESTPWVHLNTRYNKLLKELNIEFDLDLYIFPNNKES